MPRIRSLLGCTALFSAALVAIPAATAVASAAAAATIPPKPFSAGSVQIDPAGLVDGSGHVTASAEPLPGATGARVRFSATGEASVAPTGAESASVEVAPGPAPADPAAAALADATGSTVTATLTATVRGQARTASDTVWVDEFEGHTLVSELGEQDLRLQRVDALVADGTIDAAEADALDEQIRGGGAEVAESVAPDGTCVALCVEGTVLFTDAQGGTHPVDRAPVEIREKNGGTDTLITQVTTDATGHYLATNIDNDDPADATGRDVFVRVQANGPGFTFFNAGQHIDSTVDNDIPSGSRVTQNLTANNTADNNTAFSVHAALVHGTDATTALNGSPLAPVVVKFPAGGSFYDGSLNLLRPDRFDWDVILHEFGHHVSAQLNIDDDPGGPHSFSQNLSDARGSKSVGTRLAWGEGWPTYYAVSTLLEAVAGDGIPNAGDTRYQDTDDANINLDIEPDATLGEDNEVTVIAALWDVYDTPADGLDHVDRTAQSIWDALDAGDPVSLSEAYALLNPTRANNKVNCVFSQMNVAPKLNGPATAPAPAARPNFTWSRGNGGTHANNSFSVQFRRANGTVLLSTSFQNVTSFRPTAAQWTSLRNRVDGQLRVVVVGKQLDSPVTGPYRSCQRTFTGA